MESPGTSSLSQTGDIEALISAGEEEGIIQEADREAHPVRR